LKYLLDTNAFVEHLRNGPESKVTLRILSTQPNSIFLCTMVLAELLYGAIRSCKANEAANRKAISLLQQSFPSLPFDEKAAQQYAIIRAGLSTSGQLIGPNDMIIASIAMANDATLVTHNTSEFQRITGLELEDWQ
jgi:tRNA(fMet)-specific endonuclease VapC